MCLYNINSVHHQLLNIDYSYNKPKRFNRAEVVTEASDHILGTALFIVSRFDLNSLLYPEDGGSGILRNFATYVPSYGVTFKQRCGTLYKVLQNTNRTITWTRNFYIISDINIANLL